MPPSHILSIRSLIPIYPREVLSQDAGNGTTGVPVAAVIIPIVLGVLVCFFYCTCCMQKQPQTYAIHQLQQRPPSRNHQLARYSNNINRQGTRTAGEGDLSLDIPPEYSSVPLPPPAYTPYKPDESRAQPGSNSLPHTESQTNMHVHPHASGEGNNDIAVSETSTASREGGMSRETA